MKLWLHLQVLERFRLSRSDLFFAFESGLAKNK